ncbi:hypothetical protein [Streptomyces sp. NPDC021356]|uniref:hypothetical protein n=1 Tax=Streptomyces sp. NPDC021356 TaxID=3154900 RepID=UPI0033FD135C
MRDSARSGGPAFSTPGFGATADWACAARPDALPSGLPGGAGWLSGDDDHLTWYQTHNWARPYPGEKKIYTPKDVPGAYIPSPESDG